AQVRVVGEEAIDRVEARPARHPAQQRCGDMGAATAEPVRIALLNALFQSRHEGTRGDLYAGILAVRGDRTMAVLRQEGDDSGATPAGTRLTPAQPAARHNAQAVAPVYHSRPSFHPNQGI